MTMSSITRLLSLVLAAGLSTSALAVDGDWSQVAQALGKSGSEMPGGVYRVGLPRTDLKVTLDGVEIKPALALGSWLAFQKIGDQAMVMGDLVLTGEEVSPVMNKLVDGGIDITALHNHLLRSSPATLYMHVRGHGDPVTARHGAAHRPGREQDAVPRRCIWGCCNLPLLRLTSIRRQLTRRLGAKGVINGGVYQVSIPRTEAVTMRWMCGSGRHVRADWHQLPADGRRKSRSRQAISCLPQRK